jgi:hypothetical protein
LGHLSPVCQESERPGPEVPEGGEQSSESWELNPDLIYGKPEIRAPVGDEAREDRPNQVTQQGKLEIENLEKPPLLTGEEEGAPLSQSFP